MPDILLVDWEGILLEGPLKTLWAASASLRLGLTRKQSTELLERFGDEDLASGSVQSQDLAAALAEGLGRRIPGSQIEACLQAGMIYNLEGLALVGRWAAAGRVAVVGGSPPSVPEKLRDDLFSCLPPERHVYAHEAGSGLSQGAFYQVAAEALGRGTSEMALVSLSTRAREAAAAAGLEVFESLELALQVPLPRVPTQG